MNPLVSIIIPTYNRYSLIGETIESILGQTYENWELIIVDDGSSDYTEELLGFYSLNDTRIRFYQRPATKSKGANSCRNIGFQQSSGSYVKWFDSDDLMLSSHLEKSVNALMENEIDFVVSESINFDQAGILQKPFNFNRDEAAISAENFAFNRIGWITDDFLGKRQILDDIQFNEKIVDGDEYNFFIRLLQKPLNGLFLNEILTYRRVHGTSVTNQNRINEDTYRSILASLKLQTANDLALYENDKLVRWFLSGYMQYAFLLAKNNKEVPYRREAFRMICKYFTRVNGIGFLIALWTGKKIKKGYKIMKFARK